MLLIFALPFLVWRLGRTEYYAPLVVVQIVTGIVLGPGILGAVFPEYYRFVFNPAVVQSLNGIAWWAVMCFVLLAGIELDLKHAWEHRRESSTAAALALGAPLLIGSIAATVLAFFPGWIGPGRGPRYPGRPPGMKPPRGSGPVFDGPIHRSPGIRSPGMRSPGFNTGPRGNGFRIR